MLLLAGRWEIIVIGINPEDLNETEFAISLPHGPDVSIRAAPWLQNGFIRQRHASNMTRMAGIPDGATVTYKGRTFVMDDGELVEIACSFADMETALKSLRVGNAA